MSCYYTFYLARKNEEKYEYIGPYRKGKEGQYIPVPFASYSRSFIGGLCEDAWPLDNAEEVLDECLKNEYNEYNFKFIEYEDMKFLASKYEKKDAYVPKYLINMIEVDKTLEPYELDEREDIVGDIIGPTVYHSLSDEEKKEYVYYEWDSIDSDACKAKRLCEYVDTWIDDYYYSDKKNKELYLLVDIG